MSRTFLRQDAQIAASNTSDGGYSDATAPSLANFQTNPATILDDLNNLRSMLSYLKDIQVGNWYDVQTAPSALEAGSLRGVDDLNDALHLVEKKRVLRDVVNLTDVTVPAAVAATGVLTGTANFADTETVTIGSKTYTFQATLTNVDGNVQLGGSLTASLQNLFDAINLTGTPGTQYAAAMTLHPTVTATANDATTLTVAAKTPGTAGNTIATTETAANASWGGATLSGGAGDMVILTLGQLPANTTAAIGAVTTLGTSVANNASFGTATLDEVSGPNALSPKNLLLIVDGATRDPLLDATDRQIWGLLQSESATDGSTMTGTTPNRAQISFVVVNATGDDLELVDGTYIGGQVINYVSRERVRLEDLTEADFLKGTIVDTPGAATAVNRQDVYDNQGTTPVEVTTNSTLDLNGAGLFWEIRDLLNASLFRVTEGSGGGTTTVQISADVDTLDVNAVTNDFASGATLNSGGTRPITVGVTDGVIASTAGDLGLTAAGEFAFVDGNKGASTFAGQLKLSETSAEWSAYETAFGEVSLMNAIVQAANTNLHTKIYAVVTADISADTDASGPANDNNLDVNLGDLSGGTFVDDYDLYLNGVLLRPGANAAANHDYYPGTSLANGQLKFEFNLKGTGSKPDQLCLVKWV